MTAQEARKITDMANSQSWELARIYKKIEKAVTKGESWVNIKEISTENWKILKLQGYDINVNEEIFQIEW